MILIRKVKDENGWLGNMSPHPVSHDGKTYRTAEALFQSLRFDADEITESIREQKSPMAAKMKAKKQRDRMLVEPMSEADLDNMRLVLRLKILQHPALRIELLATGDQEIVEDCTRRPNRSGLFWRAAEANSQWIGENWLGRLWMEIRSELISGTDLTQRKENGPNTRTFTQEEQT